MVAGTRYGTRARGATTVGGGEAAMIRRVRGGVAGVLLFAALAAADGIPVDGRVVTADGEPAADAVVGFEWQFRGKWVPFQRLGVGKDGGFTGELHWTHRPMVLLALDSAGRNGALRVLKDEDLKGPFELKLQPLQEVTGTLECPELGALGPVTAAVETPEGARVFRISLKEPKFTIPLPPGDYILKAVAFDSKELQKPITVKADGPLDLGAVALEPTAIARAWGKEPHAFRATAARGVDPGVTLADYRGRWVLVAFWSADSADCTRALVPRLNALVERWKGSEERFAILALHEPGAATLADLDKRLEKVKAGSWQGKDPAFPILLDDTGETWRAWGVEKTPTLVLVDPEGKVVKQGTDQMLEARLREGK
ncbi:MAG: TlpA family protein disulfide reductase [Candidatus Brocadiae bacterium]|nr:TlpA family protein disulfide reductase [Candidatus Brocadiia bacterium]